MERKKPYDYLLQGIRANDTNVTGRNLEEEADSDRGRVLFSSPFRRLQNKAQVFSLEQNAAVRSRLSHSLEVSSVGRFIAQQVLKEFIAHDKLKIVGLTGKERPFITFVETACLLHDIGNPPFGHFGERAIGEWFRKRQDDFRHSPTISSLGDTARLQWEQHFSDLVNFDGNPQGFRIMTHLQQYRQNPIGKNKGANLTLTQLAACIKYPISSSTARQKGAKVKGGYYITETQIVNLIRSTFNLKEGQRHPLVYLMEAADDIAYCLSDLEDGVEKNLIIPQELAGLLKDTMNNNENNYEEKVELEKLQNALNNILDKNVYSHLYEVFWELRSSLIRLLVKRAAHNFVRYHDEILDGSLPALLRIEEPEKTLLMKLKNYANDNLYLSSTVRSREITAFRVLHGLLDAYFPIMYCDKSRFDSVLLGKNVDENDANIIVEGSLCSRLPKKYVEAYQIAIKENDRFDAVDFVREWSLRSHLILDYISGMTDEYALYNYQLVAGMRIDSFD